MGSTGKDRLGRGGSQSHGADCRGQKRLQGSRWEDCGVEVTGLTAADCSVASATGLDRLGDNGNGMAAEENRGASSPRLVRSGADWIGMGR